MKRMTSRAGPLLVAVLVGLFLILSAPRAEAIDERFVLISHAPDSDGWWNTIRNGLRVAGTELGVEVEYLNPPNGDLLTMRRLLQGAVQSGADGIITTLADVDVLGEPIKAAVEAGIPVVIINSGTPQQAADLGALMYVGQPEYEAGRAAGLRAERDGVRSFLCVNHVMANREVAERCAGFAEGLGIELGDSMLDSGQDPMEIKNKVKAWLQANPETDAILTLGPMSANPTIEAVAELGLSGKIYFGTFDLGQRIVEAIKDGTIRWGIDQQPFLQAYMPVVVLANYLRYGVLPGNNIHSGPGFVTADNLSQVERLAGEYR